jgi:hypothetical protein
MRFYIAIRHRRLARLVLHLLIPWLRQVYGFRRWMVDYLRAAVRGMA